MTQLLPPPAAPMAFAIMRNAHEVIRGAMIEIEGALAAKDMQRSRTSWEKLHWFEELHMQMEEGSKGSSPIGMFAVLDGKVDNIASKNNLSGNHDSLLKVEKVVSNAMVGDSLDDSIVSAFAAFKEENLKHLETEENIMMPSVMKIAKSGENVKSIINTEIWPMLGVDNEKFFIQYANEILQDHEEGMPRTRVFDHALWAISSQDQWETRDAWIKEVLRPEKYDEVQKAIQDWKDFQKLPEEEKKARMALKK